jgi:hypothetical protein
MQKEINLDENYRNIPELSFRKVMFNQLLHEQIFQAIKERY